MAEMAGGGGEGHARGSWGAGRGGPGVLRTAVGCAPRTRARRSVAQLLGNLTNAPKMRRARRRARACGRAAARKHTPARAAARLPRAITGCRVRALWRTAPRSLSPPFPPPSLPAPFSRARLPRHARARVAGRHHRACIHAHAEPPAAPNHRPHARTCSFGRAHIASQIRSG